MHDLVMMAMMDLEMMKQDLSFTIRRHGMQHGGIIVFSRVGRSTELSAVGRIVSGS